MTEESNFFEENDVVAVKEEPEMEIIDTFDMANEENDDDFTEMHIKNSPEHSIKPDPDSGASEHGFECEICGKRLKQKRSYTNHMQLHSNSRPYKCRYCPKTFASHNLSSKSHELTHTGEKPYACDDCPQRFSYSNSLARHRLTHLQEKQFPCKVCGRQVKSFNWLTNRELIKKTHTIFVNVP